MPYDGAMGSTPRPVVQYVSKTRSPSRRLHAFIPKWRPATSRSRDSAGTEYQGSSQPIHPPNADYPHGFAMNLTDGIVRCRFHRSYERPELLTPGEVYEIEVTAPDTANTFAAGHRIRLDVSSSNFPRFDVNTNTGEPEAAARRTAIATSTVHMDAGHPSHLRVRLEGGTAALA